MWSAWLTLVVLGSSLGSPGAAVSHGATNAASFEMRVASYNAWIMPFGSVDMFGRTKRMGPAILALEADVVCLQEVWYEDAATALSIMLSPRLPHSIIGGGGLMTLSRWPIVHMEFVPFDEHPGNSMVERLAKKGWLRTVLMTPLGPVEVVNTHLVWEGHRTEIPREERVHQAQVQALVRALTQHKDHPTILCGDLNHRAIANDKPTEDFAQWLASGFVDSAPTGPDSHGHWATRARTRVGYPRDPGIPPRGGDPDYILIRSGAGVDIAATSFRQSLDTPETALSDHNLLLATLKLSRVTARVDR